MDSISQIIAEINAWKDVEPFDFLEDIKKHAPEDLFFFEDCECPHEIKCRYQLVMWLRDEMRRTYA